MTYNTNYTHKKTCITSSAGKGVVSEFSYSLDNREDTNLTLNYISPTWTSIKHCVISFALFDAR